LEQLINLAAQVNPFFTRRLNSFCWCILNLFSNISIQEIPETQLSAGFLSSDPEDEDPIIEDVHEAHSSTSVTKRKRNVEPQNLAHKKPKKTAGEPTIVDKTSPLATRLKDAEQDLETEKEKVKALEKKIDALEEGRMVLIARLKAREETIGGRDGSIAAVQDHDKMLKKELERKELAIAIVADVIKLLSLPFTVER
jgi:chromosome segregation ATPase